jgi:hypothetical protein
MRNPIENPVRNQTIAQNTFTSTYMIIPLE